MPLLDLISQPEAQRHTTELRYVDKQLFFSCSFPCCLLVLEKVIIGVSVGEGEGGYVNKFSEKFPAAESDDDSLQNKDLEVHNRTGSTVISLIKPNPSSSPSSNPSPSWG